MVRIKYNYKNQEIEMELKEPTKLKQVLLKANINPEEVIVKRNGKVITDEDIVEQDDELEVFRIVSGG